MRVSHISVVGLFGMFNHEIPVRTDERITILHGQNGVGKTIVLRMLEGLLQGRYSILRSVPFTNFSLTFDDQTNLTVVKTAARDPEPAGLEFHFKEDPKQEAKVFMPTPLYEDGVKSRVLSELDLRVRNFFPFLTRIAPATWVNDSTGEQYTPEDLVDQFANDLAPFPLTREEPEWLVKIHNSIPTRFIRTQRLDIRADVSLQRPGERSGRYARASHLGILPAVTRYSEGLVVDIQTALADYAAKAAERDRTFPRRLLQASKITLDHDEGQRLIEEIKQRLAALENKRARLTGLGFLDTKDDLAMPPQVGVEQLGVLSIYVEDVEKKLSVFEDLANKIETLTQILNNRLQFKQMVVRHDIGFVFKTAKGDTLPPTALSSGEQHELVQLYELLFKVQPGSLILIDEPEISLHLAWQVEYLKDLRQIVALSNVDVILATHSADIIGSHWDLTVELKGALS